MRLGPHGVTAVAVTLDSSGRRRWLRPECSIRDAESPEFIGRAVAALAGDPDVGRWNGSVLVAAALAQEYGFTDIDGRMPQPLEWNGA